MTVLDEMALAPPEPGERCQLCHRRRNKKKQADSPTPREARFRGTEELVESVHEKVDLLQEYSGADPYSYPAIKIVEAALVVAIQQREEFIKKYFDGTE